MARIALLLHVHREEAVAQGRSLINWFADRGHDVVLAASDAAAVGRSDLARDDDELGRGADLAVSLGGDGSMLRTVRLVADHGVPVLGINFGQLGYLTEIDPSDAIEAIEATLAGAHQIEERMRLEVRVLGRSPERPTTAGSSGPAVVFHALNEVVVEKVDTGRTVRLKLDLNGDFFTTYAADGLIVATPTGSTAYAFSARGPIVDPVHRALVLTPVAPHSLFDRSLVLSPEDQVQIEVLEDREAALAIDGTVMQTLDVGSSITCLEAPQPARFVSFGGKDFHRTLKRKFGLNDR